MQLTFEIEEVRRNKILVNMGVKWKNFKNMLCTTFVLPLIEAGSDRLYVVPEKCDWIKQEEWNNFVRSRTTPEFMVSTKFPYKISIPIHNYIF